MRILQKRVQIGSTPGNWSAWSDLEIIHEGGKSEQHVLNFWRELNDYAVESRGPNNTLAQYRVVEKPTYE